MSLSSGEIFNASSLSNDMILIGTDLVRGGEHIGAVLVNLWLLTATGNAADGKLYIWDDSKLWDDSWFFTESI